MACAAELHIVMHRSEERAQRSQMSTAEDACAHGSLRRVRHAARGIRAIALYLFVVGALLTLAQPLAGISVLAGALLVWYLASQLRARASRAAACILLAGSAAVFCYAVVKL